MFSPYYAWANRRTPAPAEDFCAMNIVLYRQSGGAWAMTERGRASLRRGADHLSIGPSDIHWDGAALTARLDEIAVPIPRRLRGSLRLTPAALQPRTFQLDAAGRHRWRPIAPAARIEVDFEKPALRWQGAAYFDTNSGDAPLAADFSTWHWSRAATPTGATVLYDVARRDGSYLNLALKIGADGMARDFAPPPSHPLPATMWRVRRRARSDPGTAPRVIRTLEDAPFYARARISTRLDGVTAEAIHESLDLDRFASPFVRALLPFRMPRRG